MLYKKNTAPRLDPELFRSPSSEYRGTPFWAWNDMLEKEELSRQIDIFREMGLGGFHMHVRTGLKNNYLGDEYMSLVRHCVDKAKSEGMLAWLYDEDRWPSGSAGGVVTRENLSFRAKHLLFTDMPEKVRSNTELTGGEQKSCDAVFIACYDVTLDRDGFLSSYRRIDENERAEGRKWYAFLESEKPSHWYNDGTYVDTLNPKAIERFVEITHERYREAVGDEFDLTVPAIFTDEPQVTRKRTFKNSFDTSCSTVLPWTDALPEKYRAFYGEDILDTLPELFWDKRTVSAARYKYHDFVAELFASAFADTIGSWCDKNNISLTGHMMEEPTLTSQTSALGEAMRSYRSFRLPGIDLLCNSHEFTTAKQAQSAAHQYGREGVLSELYGVTGWDCDFRTYKHQGDWQAALGITVRVPHLAWYAMEGEAKRDYPASISYQSPWYKKYRVIEDHFARVNTALTRGKPVVRVAVVHPVESFWLHWGPNDTSGLYREGLEDNFKNVTEWLLCGSIDFDYICESELPSLCGKGGCPLRVGEMEYDAVILPGNETLRSTTFDRLEAFAVSGGRLYIMGKAPSLCDAEPSDRGERLSELAESIDFSRASLLTALDRERDVTIRYADGNLADDFIYQLRDDNGVRWLFVAHSEEPENADVDRLQKLRITVGGEYTVEKYDTGDGSISSADFVSENGSTVISVEMFGYDSALFRLEKGCGVHKNAADETQFHSVPKFGNTVEYELSEENVLVLDAAEFKLASDSDYSPRTEILRLDNILRERLGLPHRSGNIVQPYLVREMSAPETAVLRFRFKSEIEYRGAFLALENSSDAKITLNGERVSNEKCGYYVDIRIDKIRLPLIRKGTNELVLSLPFGARRNIENVFVLGAFGVRAQGSEGVITSLPDSIPFGDLTRYGFPFYGGSITYLLHIETENGNLEITSSYYRGALQSVSVDGEEKGDIIYPPYKLAVTGLTPGIHTIGLKLYIHRYNTFGALHLANETQTWHGPDAWRRPGAEYSDEYTLKRTGVLKHPDIK